jgi:sigma-B regulation protein RsbU (phosphoserine phosphatase)
VTLPGEHAESCLIIATQNGVIIAALGYVFGVCGWQPDALVGEAISTALIPERYREAHMQGMAKYRETGEGPVLGRRLAIEALDPAGREHPVWLTVFGYEEYSGLLFGVLRRRHPTGPVECGAHQ